MMAPSTTGKPLLRVSLFREAALELRWAALSREGSCFSTRQNSWMLPSDCSTALMKQVLPRFRSPTMFLALTAASLVVVAACCLDFLLADGRWFSLAPTVDEEEEDSCEEDLLLPRRRRGRRLLCRLLPPSPPREVEEEEREDDDEEEGAAAAEEGSGQPSSRSESDTSLASCARSRSRRESEVSLMMKSSQR
jgi:hypothetical protein